MSLLDTGPHGPESRPGNRGRRWLGAGLVALVHVALVGALMTSLSTAPFQLPSGREVFFFLPPAPKPPTRPNRTVFIPPTRPAAPYFSVAPPAPRAAIAPPPDAKGLGLSLFGCAPENLANLTPEERAHCSGALGTAALAGRIPGTVREHALEAARWQAAIAARNTPLAIPCETLTKPTDPVAEPGVGPGRTGYQVMVDMACLQALGDDADK